MCTPEKSDTSEAVEPCRRARRRNLYDLVAATAAALLFTVALTVGRSVEQRDGTLRLRWPPLYAYWLPHVGPGTPAALAFAVLTVAYGPGLARRLPWRGLVMAGWGGAMAWSWSLALVDGWQRGVAGRLTTKYEYLRSVDEVRDIGATLRGFTGRILIDAPDHWPAHVAGHPPGALLTFVGLDRAGLGGGGWAAAFVIVAGSSATAAVLVTVRALCGPGGGKAGEETSGETGGEEVARRAAPFLVLAPAAVWTGVSADGWFTAVGAWAVALLTLSAKRAVRVPWAAALGAGLLFGLLCFLSYGLVLLGCVALAVLVAAHTVRPVPLVLAGLAAWFAGFAAAGFWWFDGYFTLVDRYYQGAAGIRPYGYFVWGNLAAQVAVIGLATVAGLRRAVSVRARALTVLVAGGVCAVLLADLSGMSKAETERIWLPFSLWLLPATALLPARTARPWLAAQAALALTVNHLLITGW
ncbi:hypothetical protein ACWGJ2_34500 [Streptomyces sp. NPDC054796]